MFPPSADSPTYLPVHATPLHIAGYRLGPVLGRGGMGVVHEAVRDDTGERVAIKIVRASYDGSLGAQSRARLRKEALALSRLHHPGIARMLALESLPDEGLALVMELVPGITLRQRLSQGPLPVPLALRLCGEVAAAASHAHAAGVIHRDLKPENLMLVPDGGHLSVRVLDFGVARCSDMISDTLPALDAVADGGAHTRADTADRVLGTLRYMAPEQLLDPSAVTGQADVFALGCVLYEMLTGSPPFGAEVPELSAVAPPPPSPSTRSEGTPQWASRLVLAMLARDPRVRPDMAAVAAALSPLSPELCPFPGLQPFDEDLAAVFHGREREAAEVRALVTGGAAGTRRWLQIEGPSGSGKSSLLRAGLLSGWRRDGLGGRKVAAVLRLRPGVGPGASPLLLLAQAICGAWPGRFQLEEVATRLQRASGLMSILREATALAPAEAVLLVLDQLEEVFPLAGDAPRDEAPSLESEEVVQLDRLLAAALDDVDGPLHLLTTVRSDLLGRMACLPGLSRRLNQAARYLLLPMQPDGLREALLGPCARAGLRAEPGLTERIVADTAGLSGCLPLLGHALRAVYDGRSGDLLTLASYQAMGGVSGALSQATDELIESLGAGGQARARRLLLSLVCIEPGGDDRRRARVREEALAAAGGDAAAEALLQRLSGGRDAAQPASAPAQVRLLVVGAERVELIHEALLRHMPALRRWIDEDRRLLERREELERAAASWAAMGRPREGLAEGAALSYYAGEALADGAAARLLPLSSAAAQAYLHASRERAQRRRRARVAGVILLAVAAVLFLGMAVYARRKGQQAERTAQQAAQAAERAAQQAQRAEQRERISLQYLEKILAGVDEELAHLSGTDYSRENQLFPPAQGAIDELVRAGSTGPGLDRVQFVYHRSRADFALNYAREKFDGHVAQALADLERFAHDAVPGVEATTFRAQGYLDLADQLRDAGEEDRALQLARTAATQLERATPPVEIKLRSTAARHAAAILLQSGRIDDARRELQRAEELFPDPGEPRGFVLYYKGCIALHDGSPREALAVLSEAETLQRRLIEQNLGYLNFTWHLARILSHKGRALHQLGQTAAARDSAAQATALLQPIVEQNPRHLGYRRLLRAAQDAQAAVARPLRIRSARTAASAPAASAPAKSAPAPGAPRTAG